MNTIIVAAANDYSAVTDNLTTQWAAVVPVVVSVGAVLVGAAFLIQAVIKWGPGLVRKILR